MKTNAREYLDAIAHDVPRTPWSSRIRERVRRLKRVVGQNDDYDWKHYNDIYRAQWAHNERYFTLDLRKVDWKLVDNRIYLLGDCKPLHMASRCLWEAIAGLPGVQSIAEIGVGGGHLLMNTKAIVPPDVQFSAYDISERQIAFFREIWPSAAAIPAAVLDITQGPIPEGTRPDVVFASTVLMHIQREADYRRALQNFVESGRRYAVLMDNWTTHTYYDDLRSLVETGPSWARDLKLYHYDSGANVAIVVSRGGPLPPPYQPLQSQKDLLRYSRGNPKES
jgi:hypothetical protein